MQKTGLFKSYPITEEYEPAIYELIEIWKENAKYVIDSMPLPETGYYFTKIEGTEKFSIACAEKDVNIATVTIDPNDTRSVIVAFRNYTPQNDEVLEFLQVATKKVGAMFVK